MTDTGEPREPLPEDCCGEGCAACVWDVYREQLQRWQESQLSSSSSSPGPDGGGGLSKVHFTACTLTTITHQLTRDTYVYRFEVPCESLRPKLQPGQHLEMRGACETEEIIRKYSPINWNKNHFDVIIKRYKTGKMSVFLEKMKEGDQIDWRGPYGNFSYSLKEQNLLLILCAGTGIAPMVPIVRSIVADCEDETVVRLLCGCHSLQSRLLLPQLKELAAFWNFSFAHHVTVSEGSPGWGEEVVQGRITAEDVAQAISRTTQDQQCRVLVCGPDDFCRDMKDAVSKVKAQCYCF